MIENNEPIIYIVDLNEVEDDIVPLSAAFTVNYGPGVRSTLLHSPNIGDWIRIHSDDDDCLYYAKVTAITTDHTFLAKIDWNTCTQILNDTWSVRSETPFYQLQSAPQTIASPQVA